jgi:hypothetical protein
MGGLDSFGGLDELSRVIGVGDHRHAAGRDYGINVAREVVDEVVLRQPGEALLVDVEMGQRGGRRAAQGEQAADRFALALDEGRPCGRWSADRVHGFVPLHGERAAQIGTDGDAAVQAGEAQQLRDRDAGSGQAHDDAELSGAALRADQHG